MGHVQTSQCHHVTAPGIDVERETTVEQLSLGVHNRNPGGGTMGCDEKGHPVIENNQLLELKQVE